jgi:signal transduction histidine kinase
MPGTRINASVSLLTREPEAVFSAQLEDVTQEYAALEKERLASVRLRELDHAKDEFVTTVSHELRTPLTSIVGYTELRQDGMPTPEQKRLLGSIERNGQRLLILSNDLLVLGGLESGQAHELRETIDLGAVVASAMDAMGPIAADRRVVLTYVPCNSPVLVLGDPAQLERVLLNLLGNAVKFTEVGGKADCRIEVHDHEAWLCVSDTGIGIPTEEQAEMFRPFFRSSTTREREIQGTGLGLSIAAAIVEAHGGRIDVRSGHLEGTTVTVRLHLADAGRPGDASSARPVPALTTLP